MSLTGQGYASLVKFENHSISEGLSEFDFTKDRCTHYFPTSGVWSLDHSVALAKSVPTRAHLTDNGYISTPLFHSIRSADPILLAHWQHSFSLALTSLNNLTAEYKQIRYKLEGYQDEWISTDTDERFAYYTNIPPGNYRFEVMASSCDGVWNEVPASVNIVIRPPWWRTLWAYAAYALLAIGFGILLYRVLKWRWLMRMELHQKQQEAIRLQELDDFKNRLYTNLTHEFRTPLTVILGLIDSIEQPLDIKPVMKRNAQGLLRLINQLLDLARLEAGQLKLDLVLVDIVPFVLYLSESFSSYAAGKDIKLVTYSDDDSILMDIDEQKLHSIVSNLLTNAIKFTPEGGKIVLHIRAEQGTLVLKVKDTGVGIPAEQLPLVFNRFFRVDSEATRLQEGTGVGLALTRELVELMRGDIRIKSDEGKGTEITVTLPITQAAAPADAEKGDLAVRAGDLSGIVASLGKEVQYFRSGGKGLPQLLLIEDNEDVAFYLRTCLADSFDLTLAPNGALGIAEALESIPDLIISDVMMPEKDGFEVCEALKADERTSHIPIILLTAKADTDAKIGGLRRGADAYLTKPFDRDELLVRLDALLKRQRLLRAHFSQKEVAVERESAAIKEVIEVEDAFLQKVRTIVESHYQDESFALPQLCQKIRMSRSQLYRKMKAVADVSPSDYIRNHRLLQAKMMLETMDFNVSEVAWKVGYKEISHFSRSYQEAFGVLPSETGKDL